MKFLQRPLVKAVLKSVPFVGDVVSNLDNDAPRGEMDKNDIIPAIIRAVAIGTIVYLFLSGKIDIDQAETAKDLISN